MAVRAAPTQQHGRFRTKTKEVYEVKCLTMLGRRWVGQAPNVAEQERFMASALR